MLVIMALVPGMPTVAFLLMAAAVGMMARRIPEESATADASRQCC